MTKLFIVPDETKEYVLSDEEVEVLILNRNLQRLDIRYAPALKKIISLGECVIFGSSVLKNDVPVLNKCRSLNEIIAFGNIIFNTALRGDICCWSGIDEIPPTLTTIGFEHNGLFPCFYYDTTAPIEMVDSTFIYANPTIRECSIELIDDLIQKAIEIPEEISEIRISKKKTKIINL